MDENHTTGASSITRSPEDTSTLALRDIIQGFSRHQLWRTLAWNDIRQRYRRSLIGPLWLTLSMGIMVAALGFLYATIFRQPLDEYLPYLAVGLILWTFLSSLIIEGCNTFIAASGIIRQVSSPLTTHVYFLVWRNTIVFFHNFAIYVIVIIVFQINPGYNILYALPAVALYIIIGLWTSLLLGILCARFRDIAMMIGSLVQIMFFFTPVIWSADIIPDRQWVVEFNPFFHLIEIARAPLLGNTPRWESWVISAVITLIGITITFGFFRRYRSRVVYWA